MPKFRKKPVIIEAVKYDGTSTAIAEIRKWMDGEEFIRRSVRSRDIGPLSISTLEGEMKASPGDYIIKGVQGEFYPCKPKIFEQTYEPVDLSCTCGSGDDSPAIVHAEDCPCVDWVSGQLEDDRGKNIYSDIPEFRDYYGEDNDAKA